MKTKGIIFVVQLYYSHIVLNAVKDLLNLKHC